MSKLPRSTKVVTIGGGIIGSSTAYYLAKRGIPVLLCEKGWIGAEQSGRNQGWVRAQKRDAHELSLIRESLKIWNGLEQELGRTVGFSQTGILSVFSQPEEAAACERWLANVCPDDIEAHMVSGAQLQSLLPGATRNWACGLYTPRDGRAEPSLAAAAFAEAAQDLGAQIVTSCAVRGIETQAGCVSGVVTEHGSVRCEAAVLAGGVWSSLFCGNLGLRLPQLKTMSSIIRTHPVKGAPSTSIKGPDFSIRTRHDGGFTLGYGAWNRTEIVPDSFRYLVDYLPMILTGGNNVRLRIGRRTLAEMFQKSRWKMDETTPFEQTRVLDPVPSRYDLRQAQQNVCREFPAFASMRIAQTWAGLIDVMPDTKPVIGPVDSIPGFFISSGYSGHGFGIGPASGHLTADLVSGAPPIVDPSPFAFGRLRRGGIGREP